MGGKYKVMPKQMRIACIISVPIKLIAIIFILQVGHVISISLIDPIAMGSVIFCILFIPKYSHECFFQKSQGKACHDTIIIYHSDLFFDHCVKWLRRKRGSLDLDTPNNWMCFL